MSGKLYLVATPIGNLEDITLRALRILKEVDLIAAEDTRTTLKLLNHFEINKPLISYHRHNEEIKKDILMERLKKGENIAVVTDAGTPGISDPGEIIVKEAIETQIIALKENLNQAGVKVDAVEVTVASHEFERNLEQNNTKDEQQAMYQEKNSNRRKNIDSSILDNQVGIMTEEETLVAKMMLENGNTIDYTA